MDEGECSERLPSCKTFEDHKSERQYGNEPESSTPDKHILMGEEEIFPKWGASKIGRKYHLSLSSFDAENDPRRR